MLRTVHKCRDGMRMQCLKVCHCEAKQLMYCLKSKRNICFLY